MRRFWIVLLVAIGMMAASIADAQRFLVILPTPPQPLLLQDNASIFLLEDNASSLCLESGGC